MSLLKLTVSATFRNLPHSGSRAHAGLIDFPWHRLDRHGPWSFQLPAQTANLDCKPRISWLAHTRIAATVGVESISRPRALRAPAPVPPPATTTSRHWKNGCQPVRLMTLETMCRPLRELRLAPNAENRWRPAKNTAKAATTMRGLTALWTHEMTTIGTKANLPLASASTCRKH